MKIKKNARDIIGMLTISSFLYVAGGAFMLWHGQWVPGSACLFGLIVNVNEVRRNRRIWLE